MAPSISVGSQAQKIFYIPDVMNLSTQTKRLTVTDLRVMKREGRKIACMTAYDATFTVLQEEAGMDVILVGDSLGMVVQGYDSTLPVTVDDIVYHLKTVSRVSRCAFIIGDMPFMSYASPQQAIENAARLMQEGGAHMVKLEGSETQLSIVPELSQRGIPICAHLGLQPQAVHKMGGYRVQGRDESSAAGMLRDARALAERGADMLLLECVPAELAKSMSGSVEIPVIGIGAGGSCDGQILVLQDAIGLTMGRMPKFARDFSEQRQHPAQAIRAYIKAVKDGSFPADEHCFT